MKRVVLAEGYLEAQVPVDWVVRATTRANGQRVDVAVPEKYAALEPDNLPDEDLTTAVHRTYVALLELAEAQMRRFVRQGEPERFDDHVGAVAAQGYEWTNGVQEIATWFVQPADGIVVEIHVSLPRRQDPVARGRTLLRALDRRRGRLKSRYIHLHPGVTA
jgi:hypothetical protein